MNWLTVVCFDTSSSEMHCGCCEQSQYVNLLLVCLTLYSFVFFLHPTLLQGHKLLCYWKYLNIKVYGTFFFSPLGHLHSNSTQWKWWDCGKNRLFEWQVFMCELSECLLRVLDRLWLSDSPASPALAAILKVLERSLGVRFDVWRFSLCYIPIWDMCVFVSAAAGLFHHNHVRNDGSISVRGRWISRLYSLQIFPLNSQSAIPETTTSPCLFFFFFNLCQEHKIWSWMCLNSLSSGSTVCASVVIPAEWNGWIPEVLLEMLSGVRKSCFYSISVRNQKFSWLVSHGLTGYRRHSSVGELWTSSQSVRALLHVLCFCTASLLAPVASSSHHVEITSLLLISNRTFYFCLRCFWRTGVRLVFVFPLCVTHIPGCENVEKGLSKVWMNGWGLSGFSGTFFLVAVL